MSLPQPRLTPIAPPPMTPRELVLDTRQRAMDAHHRSWNALHEARQAARRVSALYALLLLLTIVVFILGGFVYYLYHLI